MVCVPALGPTLACGSHTTGLRSRLLCAHTSRRRSASSAWRRTAATSFATLTAHGRPVSHLHHRDALLDPLHGLVLAAVVSGGARAGHCHARGVGQHAWGWACGSILAHDPQFWSSVVGLVDEDGEFRRLGCHIFGSLLRFVWGCRAFPRLVLPELSFSRE